VANLTPQKGSPFLTRDESKASFAIIRHNIRTYESAGVVQVVKGRENADTMLKNLTGGQSSADRQEGWRYFCEKTDLRPGMDPEEATQRRQAALELRESEAGDSEPTN